MRKTILLAVLIAAFQLSFGQTISERQATELLQKAVSSLKTGDTTTFASLWHYDNTGRPYDNSVFTRKDAMQEFGELKVFLDTALMKNMHFDYVDVDDFQSWSKYKVKYKIKAWYKYDERLHYYKGFGVLVDYVDGKWKFRFTFERSTSYRDK